MPGAAERVSITHVQGATPQEKDTLEQIVGHIEAFENGMGRDFRERCTQRYRQYRGFRAFRDAWTKAGPNDRDGVVYDAKKHWGAHLHIPLSYRTIETMVPRSIAHRPRMLVLPRQEQWAENVVPVRLLLDAQQDNIDIDLPFQAVMRSGRIYGLGVGKTYWRKEQSPRRGVKRRMFRPSQYVAGDMKTQTTFDDPMFEDVDVFDFGWDPYGDGPRTCEWMYHRVWLSTAAVMQRIQVGTWNTESARGLTEEDVRKWGAGQRYDDIWQDRMEASGFANARNSARGEQPHEVIEFHDGVQVRTVLDRQVLVQDAESSCVGEMPFQVYRPTPLQKQMVGIGDLEPLEHIQRELDTLRSQRRDAATLALAGGYAYDSAAIDEDDLEFGPNAAIPVRNGDPRNALLPLQIRDVPGSGYQEETVIRQDFDVVSGMQDALDNSPGGTAGTATEAQLMQAALGLRIALSSRRFEIEVVRHAARCFLALDQRMILSERASIAVPDDGMTKAQAGDEGRWQWFRIGPAQLQGEFTIVPEGGSMAARNVPQDRQDAMQILQNFGQNPYVDPQRPLLKALQLYGIEDPESWLKQSAPPIPQSMVDVLKQMLDPSLVDFAVSQAQKNDPQLAQQGPTAQDVGQMMGNDQEPQQ